MTPAAALLHDLRARGVVLRVEGDRLLGGAPRGVLTPEDRAGIAAFKAELVAALEAEAAAIIVDDVLAIFPGARVVRAAPPGLVCARCGTSGWWLGATAG